MKKRGYKHEPSGSGLPTGLVIDLDFTEINRSLTDLCSYVDSTSSDVDTKMFTDAINRVYHEAQSIAGWRKEHGGKSEPPVYAETYYKAVDMLRRAANRGRQEAADALKSLGESLEPSSGHPRRK